MDVVVTLPPNSKTTSLRGGYLLRCPLYDYGFVGGKTVPGHKRVDAEGQLLVGLGDGNESIRLKQGCIWGGGRCRCDRPFLLVFNHDKQYARMAQQVAERINQTFRTSFDGLPGGEIAVAHAFGHSPRNGENGGGQGESPSSVIYIDIKVPPQYRLNMPRFLRVVGLIPRRGGNEGTGGTFAETTRRYRARLDEEILDPATTVTAALRLEAMGEASRSSLKIGLQSPHTLVRFCCAESLAYLGDPSCGKELGRLIVEQPALRAFSLTALASLDEAVSQDTLQELLASPVAEIRYGAFRALRALNEHDPTIRGESLNDSFWLHHVAPGTTPLIHVSATKRPEIVLFGDDIVLKPPFTIQAGEYNVTAADEDAQCTVSRFSARSHSSQRRQYSLKVEDLVRGLATMGATYPDVVEVLKQARSCQCVCCPVESDALPQATSVYALKKAGERAKALTGKQLPDASDEDEEILNARLELGATPTLFEKDNAGRIQTSESTTPASRSRKPNDG